MFDICVCGWERLLSLKPDPIEIILYKTNDGTKVTLKQNDIDQMFSFTKLDSHQECDNTTVDLYTTKLLDTRYAPERIEPEKRLIELGSITDDKNQTF